MEVALNGSSSLFAAVLEVFEARPAIWSLGPISVLAGVGMLWVFRKTSNQTSIRRLKKRRQAFLLEIRLFGDEPAMIWRAQKALLAANARYIGYMLWPVVVLTPPMLLLFVQLEAFYGRVPLRAGQAALITAQWNGPLPANAPALEAPDGIAVEGPPVRVAEDGQISWRLRARNDVEGLLQLRLEGMAIEKSIAAGAGPRYLNSRRPSSWPDFFWSPGEARLPAGPVDWIEVGYPAAEVSWMGFELHWLWWFLIFSMASALVFRKWMKVTF